MSTLALNKLHVGFSIFTGKEFPVASNGSPTAMQVSLLIDGEPIAQSVREFQVGPDISRRLQFDVPFAYKQLLKSGRFSLVISFPASSGEVSIDDVFVLPES